MTDRSDLSRHSLRNAKNIKHYRMTRITFGLADMTNFHPDDHTLSEYVAGTLAESQALCVATHLAHCDECKRTTNEMTQLGAAYFSKPLTTCETSDDLLQKILTSIDSRKELLDWTDTLVAPGIEDDSPQFPHALSKLIPEDLNDLRWRRLGNKHSIAKLDNLGDQREITLHKLQPGRSVSSHDHNGCEITVVLRGSFSDEDGEYWPGDFLVRNPGEVHQPVVNSNQVCLCLAVCDAPIKLTGLLTRLFNPLIAFQHKRLNSCRARTTAMGMQ